MIPTLIACYTATILEFTAPERTKIGCIFFQNGRLDPPVLPPFEDSKTWTNINEQDSECLREYLQLLEVNESRARTNKKRRLDNVDITDQLVATTSECDQLVVATSECEVSIEEVVQKLPHPSTTYWDSPEAHFLFCPQNSEGVMACLIRRDLLLRDAMVHDLVLQSLVDGCDDISSLSVKKREHLRIRCIYMRKCYETAMQYMNQKTWNECISIAISELSDQGINYIHSQKPIRNWNIEFREKEVFQVPFNKEDNVPKLFTYFPEVKSEFASYCNKKQKPVSFQLKRLILN